MHYQLIGVDLDGTLLDADGEISAENAAALTAAREAGVMVAPCTSRAWHEAQFVLRNLPGLELGVFVTGAMVADVATGSSVDLSLMEPHLAWRVVELLSDEPEAVLVFQEAARAGHHYLVTGRGELTDNTRWWFELTGAAVHFQRKVTPGDLRHALRVGAVASISRVAEMERKVLEAMGDRVQVHHFAALNSHGSQDQPVAVLEVFATGAHKWRGLSWIARRHGIEPGRVAAIGDGVNDLAMLREAGCGIAMGNGADAARDSADRVTRSNAEGGVAYAIDRMLRGEW